MILKKFPIGTIYTFSNCSYYALSALVINFSTLYLRAFGLSTSVIGVVFAVASCICIGLEALISYRIDNGRILTNTRVLIGCNLLLAVLAAIVFAFQRDTLLMLCIYTIIFAFVISMQQYTNALGMEIGNAGIPIHYGTSRGAGSVVYILVTLLVGTLLQKQGSSIFPLFLFVVSVISVPVVCSFPRIEKKTVVKESISGSYLSVFRDNPRLVFVFLGIALVSIFTSCVSYYMLLIVQNLGGNAETLAYINSLGTFCEVPFFFLYNKISKRFSCREIFLFSTGIYMIRCITYTLAKSMVVLYLTQTLQGLSYSLFLTSSIMLINEMTSNQNKAKGQALLNMTIMCVGNIISSIVGGILIDSFGIKNAMLFNCGCMFAGLLCCAIATLPDIIKNRTKTMEIHS